MEGYLRNTREFLHLDCPEGKLAALPVDSASGQDLENVEAAGEAAIGMECTVLNHGETIMPASGKCYELTFDSNRWETTFPIDASSTSAIAFFAQHLPTEFEEDTHYLKLVSTGEDIEPVAEEMGGHDDDDEEASRPWVKALGAALLINLVTLAGLIFAIPFIASALKKADPIFVHAGFASFAAGAILSCAFFLLLFESTHLIAEGWDEETEHIWRWGTMILLGLILPVIVESIVGHVKPDDSDSKADMSDKFSDEYKQARLTLRLVVPTQIVPVRTCRHSLQRPSLKRSVLFSPFALAISCITCVTDSLWARPLMNAVTPWRGELPSRQFSTNTHPALAIISLDDVLNESIFQSPEAFSMFLGVKNTNENQHIDVQTYV